MSCIIISKSKSVPTGIWSRAKSKIASSYLKFNIGDLVNNFGSVMAGKNYEVKQGFGIFLKIGKNNYVVTCFHIIGLVNMEVFAFANDNENIKTKIQLDFVNKIPEMDLAILKFRNVNQENQFYFYTKQEATTKITDILNDKDQIFLNTLEMSGLTENNIIKSNTIVTDVEVTNEDFIGHIIPKIPLVTFKHELLSENDNEAGLSGSVLTLNNVPIGMIASIAYGKLQAIPMVLIYLMAESIVNDKYKTICCYNIPTKTAKTILSDGSDLYGKHVQSDINVQYKIYSTRYFTFRLRDFIIKVNNCIILDNGMMHCEDIGMDVTFDTFLMINCFLNQYDYCNFEVIRQTGNIEKTLKLNITGLPLNNIYNVNVFNNHRYVFFKGFIFTESSEELIDDVKNLRTTKVTGHLFEQLKMTDGNQKYVVLVDIDQNFINQDSNSNKDISNIELPYPKTPSGITMYILDKIGNKKITCLNDIETAIKHNNKKMVLCYQLETNFIYCEIK